uniref:Uncharacterized 3.5 kDa protein in COX1 5'region n=1 Tax=Emericella nidulans TaxID=162425 RepID=YMCD_EMEND|nr:RecName: Full=Uncharacterized 3.5 kDa protein in COX1 5'region; AltName: Full=URF-D [Aspergillus nidulans]AAA99209.1 unknown protein [Aspergillus nidulans]CAA30640.1 unnamed protein product [Aspergillus nidulans]
MYSYIYKALLYHGYEKFDLDIWEYFNK